MKSNLHTFLICSAFMLILIGCTSKDFKEARNHFNEKDFLKAIPLLESEILNNPKNDDAYLMLGQAYLDSRSYKLAFNSFSEALKLNPDHTVAVSMTYFEIANEDLGNKDLVLTNIDLFKKCYELNREMANDIKNSCLEGATELIRNDILEGFKYVEYGVGLGKRLHLEIKEFADVYYSYANRIVNINSLSAEPIVFFKKALSIDESKKENIVSTLGKMIAEYDKIGDVYLLLSYSEYLAKLDNNFKPKLDSIERKYLFIDSRDGKRYRTVEIGKNTWFAENLSFKPTEGKYWVYDKKSSHLSKFGYLYDWETAQTVCPDGWHLSTLDEWEELERVVDRKYNSGEKIKIARNIKKDEIAKYLKSDSEWSSDGNGNNISRFSALPGGFKSTGTSFQDIYYTGNWWTSTTYRQTNPQSYSQSIYNAWLISIIANQEKIYMNHNSKQHGFSVRCVKD